MSESASIVIDDGSSWKADGPLKEILSAFNGGSPLEVVNSVKSLITDGFTVSGTAHFMGDEKATVTTTVMKNGDITILAELASAQLSHLLGASGNLHLPAGFEVPLLTTSIVIKRSGSTLSLNAASVIPNVGQIVFVAQHTNQWQVAVGVELELASVAALPGLRGSSLAVFDKLSLCNTMMVLFSYEDAEFDFPEVSSFQAPTLKLGKIALPKQAAGKLVEGLNIYAGLNTATNNGFQAIAKFLKLQLDGSTGVALAVSLPDPVTNSKLFLSVQEEIKPGVTLNADLGFLLAGTDLGVFLTGTATAHIQGQPAQFDVTALVVENGALFSGSMINPAPIHFDIGKVSLSLADVGIVIGIDDEGVPSFGFCATVDIDRFNAAVAIFMDSTDPAKSMFAAAVTGMTLLDVVEVLAKQQTTLPAGLRDTLDAFGLKACAPFSLPVSIGHSLDNRDLKAIAAAFEQNGITIPSSSDQILLDVTTQGKLWYLTHLEKMHHYILKLTNNAIVVSLEPQLYVAPQATSIGALSFQEGYKVSGELDLLVARGRIDIDIAGLKGINGVVDVDPIILHSPDFLAITGTGGVGGPQGSLVTYDQPQETVPQLRPPHFIISGELSVLGATVASVNFDISKSGISIEKLTAYINPLVQISLDANIQSPKDSNLGGSITVGVNNQLDLGSLGKVLVRANACGSLNFGIRNGTAFATFQAGLNFESWNLETPLLTLDVNSRPLVGIEKTMVSELEKLISDGLLKDVQRFLDWAKRDLLQDMSSVTQIAGVLKNDFKLAGTEAGKLLHQFDYDFHLITQALKSEFGMTAKDVASFLKNTAGVAPEEVDAALKSAGYTAHDIKDALDNVFDKVKTHL